MTDGPIAALEAELEAPPYHFGVNEPLVESVAGTPAPPLRSIVGRYRGYRIDGAAGTHRGLPSRHLTFIISLHDPVDIARMPDGAPASRLPPGLRRWATHRAHARCAKTACSMAFLSR